MPTPPILTPEQRAAALEKAAYARKARAEVKERLKMGILTLPNLFKEAELEIAPSRRLGGLGTKQKAALLNKFSSQ